MVQEYVVLLQGWQGAGNILQVLQIQQLLQAGMAQPQPHHQQQQQQQQQQQAPQPNQAQLNNLNLLLLLPSLANVMQVLASFLILHRRDLEAASIA